MGDSSNNRQQNPTVRQRTTNNYLDIIQEVNSLQVPIIDISSAYIQHSRSSNESLLLLPLRLPTPSVNTSTYQRHHYTRNSTNHRRPVNPRPRPSQGHRGPTQANPHTPGRHREAALLYRSTHQDIGRVNQSRVHRPYQRGGRNTQRDWRQQRGNNNSRPGHQQPRSSTQPSRNRHEQQGQRSGRQRGRDRRGQQEISTNVPILSDIPTLQSNVTSLLGHTSSAVNTQRRGGQREQRRGSSATATTVSTERDQAYRVFDL